MAISAPQVGAGLAKSAGGGVTTASNPFTPKSNGNLLIVVYLISDGTATPTVSDSAGNAWNQFSNSPWQDNGASSPGAFGAWWAISKGSVATTVTGAGNALQAFSAIYIDEFTGVDTVNAIDQVARSANQASGTTPDGGAVIPGSNDELVWGWGADSLTAVGPGFTKGADDGSTDWSEYRVLQGGQGISVSAPFTGSGRYNNFTACFRPISPVWYFTKKNTLRRTP